jgi:hypothetical protein
MISKNKVRTIFIFVAAMIELLIAFPSAVYLKVESAWFLAVMITALISTGSIIYFVLQYDMDAMK